MFHYHLEKAEKPFPDPKLRLRQLVVKQAARKKECKSKQRTHINLSNSASFSYAKMKAVANVENPTTNDIKYVYFHSTLTLKKKYSLLGMRMTLGSSLWIGHPA